MKHPVQCGSTLWDAKRRVTATVMFDSPNTWKDQYSTISGATSRMQNAIVTTTFMFESRKRMELAAGCAEQPAECKMQFKYYMHVRQLSTIPGATGVALQHHESPNAPPCHEIVSSGLNRKIMKNPLFASAKGNTIRAGSDHDPTMKTRDLAPARLQSLFVPFWRRILRATHNISRPGYLPKFPQILHAPRKATLQLHRILRLPRKVTFKHHCSNITKYYACHKKWQHSNCQQILRLPRKVTHESSLPFSSLLSSTLLFSTLPFSTRLFSTLLFSSFLYSTLITLLYSSLLYSSLSLSNSRARKFLTQAAFDYLYPHVLCESLWQILICNQQLSTYCISNVHVNHKNQVQSTSNTAAAL